MERDGMRENEQKVAGERQAGWKPAPQDGEHPLDEVARRNLALRLRRAARMVREELPAKLGRFRRILDEAADQAEAWHVARRLTTQGAAPRGARSRVSASVLTCIGGAPVKEFRLIPFGEVRVERPVSGGGFVFTRGHAESARRWFDAIGRKLAIDYEHQSLSRMGVRSDGLRPAAGWIGKLEVRDDGLWAADVRWTPRALALLRSGEYRYFSPVIYWTDEDCTDVAALGPVALTNDPAMHGVQPLAATRDEGREAPPERIAGTETVLQNKLDAARQENALLRRELTGRDADAFLERGLRLGKIVESTSEDWREDYLRDPEQAEARLSRAPVLLPQGRVLAAGGGAPHRPRHTPSGVEPEDIEAYERAAAAGRVRM